MTGTAAELAASEPELSPTLLDTADRIVILVTALPCADAEDDPCTNSFALEALGSVFLGTLRSWQQAGPAAAKGIARAITRFVERMLTEDHEDAADTLHQLNAVALGQALDAHPAPGAPHRRVVRCGTPAGAVGACIQCAHHDRRCASRCARCGASSPAPRITHRDGAPHRPPDPMGHRTTAHITDAYQDRRGL
ncbi:hypothetical protein ABZ769_26925 [Streptomyces olivoreticuli]